MNLDFTIDALNDLRAIRAWIYQDNPRRAGTFIDEIEASCQSLAEMPLLFPVFITRNGYEIRRRVYGSYLIFYRVEPNRVLILHVGNGARDWANKL